MSCCSHRRQQLSLRVSAKILNIAEVAVSNLLPSMTFFPLHYVEKQPSFTINNHQTGAGLVSEVKWISQPFQASVRNAGLVCFLIAKQEQWKGSHLIL